jgi:hypothetical protein
MLPSIVTGSPAVPVDPAAGIPGALRSPRTRHMCMLLNRPLAPASRFGDFILVAFLVAQVLDGVLTYLGVMTFGRSVEANPLLHWLMATVGDGPALTGAKVVAGSCGIALHLTAVHHVVALLTAFYLAAAILPWAAILFFY